MKYAVIKVVNGHFEIVSEWADEEKAIVNFHTTCMTLWNAEDVSRACVKIVNENLETVKVEYIKYSIGA